MNPLVRMTDSITSTMPCPSRVAEDEVALMQPDGQPARRRETISSTDPAAVEKARPPWSIEHASRMRTISS